MKYPRFLVLSSFNYCLGRMTAYVSDCCDFLVDNWEELDEQTKVFIIRDLEEAFNRDDEDRFLRYEHKRLGMDCDRYQWERVRKLYKGENNG